MDASVYAVAHPMKTRLILLEGIPGSGKTTIAEWIAQRLRRQGIDAELSIELRADHPVIDRALMKTSRVPGYGDRCVDRWRDFASRALNSPSPAVHILEGCLFQSTVRFLLEHDHPEYEPDRYFSATQDALEQLQPRIVYLRQADARTFMREQHGERKGDDVIAKIAGYTETTAIAKRHDWKGISGMIEVYLHYRGVCDRLIESSRYDVIHIDTSGDDWASVRADLANWLA